MRALNVLLSILVSLGLALLVLEGGLRLFPAFRPQESLNHFDARLGWVKRPNASVGRKTSEFSVTFETNAQGLRDDAGLSTAKPTNTFRVMALGDSFVLGYTVDRRDLFVDQLERYWSSEERRVEVVNAGTEGYSTDQEVLWFQEHGLEYEPDLVLLFPYENDIYWNGQAQYTRFPKPRFLPDGTLETGLLEDPGPGSALRRWAMGIFLQQVVFSRIVRQPVPRPNHFQPDGSEEWIFDEFAPLLTDPPLFLTDAVARTRGALSALAATCDEAGARLVMVPIPSESAVDPDERERFASTALKGMPPERWSPDRPVDLFLKLGRELGIETLDPRTTLRAHAENGQKLYFEQEWHFTPEGNLAFAKYLNDELESLGVFPPEHQAIARGEFTAPEEDEGLPVLPFVFLGLWGFLSIGYAVTYRDEPAWQGSLKVGGLLLVIFGILRAGGAALAAVPPSAAPWIVLVFVLVVLGFVAYKLGNRLGTILELFKAFTLRGHWYLMPLVVVLLTIGSLLVVAASSPLIAPFIYTLF